MIPVPAVWLWDPKHSGYIGPEEVLMGYGRLQVEDDIKHAIWIAWYRGLMKAFTDEEVCTKGAFV